MTIYLLQRIGNYINDNLKYSADEREKVEKCGIPDLSDTHKLGIISLCGGDTKCQEKATGIQKNLELM